MSATVLLILALLLTTLSLSLPASSPPLGFPNLANTCYMNSLLQSLDALPLVTSSPLSNALESETLNDRAVAVSSLLSALGLDPRTQEDVTEAYQLLHRHGLLPPGPLTVLQDDVIVPLDKRYEGRTRGANATLLALPLTRSVQRSLKEVSNSAAKSAPSSAARGFTRKGVVLTGVRNGVDWLEMDDCCACGIRCFSFGICAPNVNLSAY